VLACDPPTSLSVTWEYAGQVSWVDVTLSPADGGTLLRLDHVRPTDPATWGQLGPGVVGIGWEMALMGIDEHLLSPDADPAEAAAWMAGPEGRAYFAAFVPGASAAWAGASIAFGTDPEVARAAADRCTAAYTTPPAG
jgi:hypothetical protein